MIKDIFREPDLASKPFGFSLERVMELKPATLYVAWTKELDVWFAAPGSVLMNDKVNTPFFFETEFKADENSDIQRHPHYGRFLKLVPDKLVMLTWVTGAGGTNGFETVVTVYFTSKANNTLVKLTHSGFPDEETKLRHQLAWPMVLEHLQLCYLKK